MTEEERDWLLAKTFTKDWWKKYNRSSKKRVIQRERKGYQGAKMSGFMEETRDGLFYEINWGDGTTDRVKLGR